MALKALRAVPDAPSDLRERIEAAHARLHRTRCQGWMAVTGRRPAHPYGEEYENGHGEIATVKTADPMPPRYGCKLHPVGSP